MPSSGAIPRGRRVRPPSRECRTLEATTAPSRALTLCIHLPLRYQLLLQKNLLLIAQLCDSQPMPQPISFMDLASQALPRQAPLSPRASNKRARPLPDKSSTAAQSSGGAERAAFSASSSSAAGGGGGGGHVRSAQQQKIPAAGATTTGSQHAMAMSTQRASSTVVSVRPAIHRRFLPLVAQPVTDRFS